MPGSIDVNHPGTGSPPGDIAADGPALAPQPGDIAGTSIFNIPFLDANGKLVTTILPDAATLKAFLQIAAADITDASANGRSLITAANYAAMRTLLGLVVGTNVQAWDADLDAIAAIATTTYGRNLLALADQAALRTAVGVPYVTAESVGASGYRTWSDGYIEQWGTLTPTGGAGSATFPIAFPANADVINLTPLNNFTTTNGAILGWLTTKSTTGFTSQHRFYNGTAFAAENGTYLWRANGR